MLKIGNAIIDEKEIKNLKNEKCYTIELVQKDITEGGSD